VVALPPTRWATRTRWGDSWAAAGSVASPSRDGACGQQLFGGGARTDGSCIAALSHGASIINVAVGLGLDVRQTPVASGVPAERTMLSPSSTFTLRMETMRDS
jgi:hypothetical protein